MSFDHLPVAHGEMRVGKVSPRTVNGKKVLDLWLVQNNQIKDPNNQGKWIKDPEQELWMLTTLWEKAAENVYGSIKPGDYVHVTFDFTLRSYVDKEQKTVTYLQARLLEPLSLSTRFRAFPHSDQQGGGQQAQQQGGQQQAGGQQKSQAAQSEQGGYNPDEEPPF